MTSVPSPSGSSLLKNERMKKIKLCAYSARKKSAVTVQEIRRTSYHAPSTRNRKNCAEDSLDALLRHEATVVSSWKPTGGHILD